MVKTTWKRLITNLKEDHDLSESFSEKVNLWFQKWIEDKGLDKSWGKFIEPSV